MKKTVLKQDKWELESGKWLILIFIFAAIVLLVSGVFYLKNEDAILSKQALKQLQSTSVLKTRQIEAWRREKLSDAREIAQSPLLQDAVYKWKHHQDKKELKNEIQQRLQIVIQNNPDSENILITDTTGLTLLTGKTGAPDFASASTGKLVRKVIKTNSEIFGDLYKNSQDSAIYADIAFPIYNDRHEIDAVILFRLNAGVSLFPILKDLTYDSTTEEAFLFEKAGDSVLYLTNLRSWPNAALSLTFPLTNNENPAVRAVNEAPGFYEGKGYHGQKVLEYIQPINGSPWFLASKIDRDELFKPVYQRTKTLSIILILLFLALSSVVFLIFNYRRKHFYRQLLEEEQKTAAFKGHFEYVVRYANDIILLEDENLNIIEANQRAQQTYQYSLEELLNMKITDLVAPDSKLQVETRLKNITEKDGAIIESIHQRKDGSLFDVEISARIINVNGRAFLHQVIRNITERKQAEIALAESEERFRTTLYSTGDAIITTDIDGKVRYMNPVAEELTGWKESEAGGKPIREVFSIFNEDTREEVENPVDKVLKKGMIVLLSNHTFLKAKNGSEIPIGDSGAPIRNAKGEIAGVVLVFRDQIKERLAKRTIEESELHFHSLANFSPVGIFRTRPDGYTTYVNPKWCQLSGLSAEKALGDGWLSAVHTEDREKLADEWKLASQSDSVSVSEYRFLQPDGTIVYVLGQVVPEINSENQITGYIGTITDITEQKQAEELLKSAEFKFRIFADYTYDWEYWEDENSKLVYISPSCQRITGYTSEEFISDPGLLDSIIHHGDVDSVLKHHEKTYSFQNRNERNELEFRIIKKDGSVSMIYHSCSPIFDENKKFLGRRVSNSDITERKQAEQQLRLFRTLIDSSNDSFEIIDPETGQFIDVNERGCNDLGYTREEMLSLSVFDIDPKVDKPAFQNIKDELLKSENGIWEGIHLRKDGTTFPVEVNIIIVELDRKYMVSVARDITSRKQAELALRENKERWQNLFNYSPDAIAIYQAVDNGDDFIFTDFNLKAQITDNLKHDYVIGKRISELFPAADQIGLLDVFRKVWRTGKTEYLNSTFYKDNRIEGWRENIIYKLNTGEIVAIYNDTTERELARIALSKSEEKFRKLFDDHAAIKLIVDPETGNIVEANKAASVFYGWTKQELSNMNVNQLNTLAPEEIKREIIKAQKNNQNFFESGHRLKDGAIKDVAVFTSPIKIDGKEYLHSIVQDITNSKLAEKQLKLLGRAIDQNPVSIVITNTDGVIQYVNPKFTEVTGYTSNEVIGINPRILQSGEHSSEFYKELWDTILSGADWHGEFHDKKKNGEDFWESAVISPVFDDSGKISSFVAVKEDITEKKKIIQDLIIAKEHAEESDRLKTAFLTNISHEIRTPMNGILGFAELLKMPGLSGDQQQEYISIIKKSSDRMLNIINDIVDISKIESGLMKVEMKESNINEQTEYIYSFFNLRAERKGIKLICKNGLSDKDAIINTDKEKVYAILTNLVKNAIKFTENGSIEFGYTLKQGIHLSSQSETLDELEFFVKDTGIGIPKDRQQAIFDRFIQADIADTRAYQGAGLGLSISKAYVEMLGGKIWVESEEGMGSVFYFSIPYYAKQEEKKVHHSNGSEVAINKIKKLKILIVEDDFVSEMLLSIALKEHNNNEVFKAYSGDEAITMCRNNPDIDLVMMDIKMPGMDGYQAASEIRKFNNDIIIIAQTAFSLAGDREKALAAGCNDYISKPIQQNVLWSLIDKHFKS